MYCEVVGVYTCCGMVCVLPVIVAIIVSCCCVSFRDAQSTTVSWEITDIWLLKPCAFVLFARCMFGMVSAIVPKLSLSPPVVRPMLRFSLRDTYPRLGFLFYCRCYIS